jgi:hypothetical protein
MTELVISDSFINMAEVYSSPITCFIIEDAHITLLHEEDAIVSDVVIVNSVIL